MECRSLLAYRAVLVVLASWLSAGCGGDETNDNGPRSSVKVLTRNLYLGGDFVPIIMATVPQIPAKAADFWDSVRASDFPARAEVLADEIAAARPDIVALQEVEWFRVQTPSNFSFENPMPPDAPSGPEEIDFLKLLRTALAKRDMRYTQEFVNTLSDAELPIGRDPQMLSDLRMTDRDVVLVREGVTVSNVRHATYMQKVPLRIGAMTGPTLPTSGGVPVDLVRGYTAFETTVDGATFTFVNSHLEVGGLTATIQEEQGRELVQALKGMKGPLIVAGDFNSAADGSGTRSYANLLQNAGLVDAWPKVRQDPGLTCCTSLKAESFMGRSRIDLVLYKGSVRAEAAEVIGTDPAKRTPGGLWPSDHAGVVVTLSVAKPN